MTSFCQSILWASQLTKFCCQGFSWPPIQQFCFWMQQPNFHWLFQALETLFSSMNQSAGPYWQRMCCHWSVSAAVLCSIWVRRAYAPDFILNWKISPDLWGWERPQAISIGWKNSRTGSIALREGSIQGWKEIDLSFYSNLALWAACKTNYEGYSSTDWSRDRDL